MANNYIYFAMCELFKKKRKSVSILLSLTPKIHGKLLLTRVMERISRKKRLYFKGKCMNDEDVHGPSLHYFPFARFSKSIWFYLSLL